jgi:Sec-independent protein translocase protein TatA
MGEITVILLLALIFLGPKKLPELASGLGKLIKDIRKVTADVKNEIQLDDAIRKPFEELRDAVTLHPDELKRRDEIKKQIEEVRLRAQELSDAEAKEAKEAAEQPPGDDVTVVQASPLPDASVGDKVIDVSKPPAGTIARGGLPASGSTTARYGSSGVIAGPGASTVDAPLADAARAVRPPLGLPLPRRVTPPVTSADKGDTTQALTEADLLPSGSMAPSMFPPPPPSPSSTARLPGLPPSPPTDATADDSKKST